MIIVIKHQAAPEQVQELIQWVRDLGLDVHQSRGDNTTLLGLIGDTSKVDIGLVSSLDMVERVTRIQEPYKNANRKFHPQDSLVSIGGRELGGKHFQVMAGPCAVESEEQICHIAALVKEAGATMLRGGAFKPRTSPYAFQGLGKEGIDYLCKAKALTGLPIVTEIMNINHLDYFQPVDVIQVGARNMQNFELLKELGHCNKPILLKRGLANTIQEWLMSAEYIMAGGNAQVILCERGIRTFETATRNTLDVAAIPLLKELSHLPVVVDPSHACGKASLVPALSLAAASAGCDGLIVEVHHKPECALSDGAQSLRPQAFASLMDRMGQLLPLFDKQVG